MNDTPEQPESIVIRKYANRRLYNTGSGEFVTLETLREMVHENVSFKVVDAKSGQDITSSILAQIIAEQEGRGESMLPDDILRQIISFYDQGLTDNYAAFLRESMEAFNQNASQMEALGKAGMANIDLFQKSMAAMFGMAPPASFSKPDPKKNETEIDELKEEMRRMQEKLNRLSPDD